MPMTGLAIEIENLTKEYPFGFLHLKKKTSLEGLNMQVEMGEVFGFIGPNGAGKSTTIKLLMRLIFPTAGSARILGRPISDVEMHKDIGYLPEQPYFYDYLTAAEVLDYFARFHDLRAGDRKERVERMLKKVGLETARKIQLRKYSKGMLQRVGVIVGGKLRGVGAPGQLVDMKTQGMEILFALTGASDAPLLAKAMKTGECYRLQVAEGELYAAIEQLRGTGARILSVTQVKATLEEFFMNLVEADRAQAAAVEVSGK